jgi:hypothetical protein
MLSGRTGTECNTSASVCTHDDNMLSKDRTTIKKNKEALLEASKEVGLEVNTKKNEVYGYVLPS